MRSITIGVCKFVHASKLINRFFLLKPSTYNVHSPGISFDSKRVMNKNILVVDDHIAVREVLKGFIQHRGFRAFAVENAEEALKLLKERQFNLMLVDYTMPGMKGDELVRLTKKQYPNIKSVGMSSYDNEENFYKAGVDSFIGKPFNLSKLEDLLKSI